MIVAGGFFAWAVQAAAAPAPCTAANSARVGIAAINAAPERFVGRCVTIEGPADRISMFSGVDGLYLSQRYGADGNSSAEGLRHRLGLYSEDDGIRQTKEPRPGYPKLKVTGRVDTCERMYAEAKTQSSHGFVMMAGYCHYHGGAVVRATGYAFDWAHRYERLAGERARARVGSLVAPPAGWPGVARLNELAEQFRAAVFKRDGVVLAALHDLDPGGTTEREASMVRHILDDPASPFVSLRTNATAPYRVFVDYFPPSSDKARNRPVDHPYGYICYCRTSSCTDVWPIASMDTNNSPERPYLCTSTQWRREGVALHTSFGAGGLLERRRKAYTRASVSRPSR